MYMLQNCVMSLQTDCKQCVIMLTVVVLVGLVITKLVRNLEIRVKEKENRQRHWKNLIIIEF